MYNFAQHASDPEGTVLTFTASGLPPGTMMSTAGLLTVTAAAPAQTPVNFSVTARDASNMVSSIVCSIAVVGDVTAPTVPTGLTIAPQVTQTLRATWLASSDANSPITYLLERSIDLTNWTQIYSGTSLSFDDTGRSYNVSYYYRVRARDPSGNTSGYSSTVSGSLTANPPQWTGVPAALTLTENTGQHNFAQYASDPDGGTLTYSLVSGPGSVSTVGVYTASATSGSIIVRVTDPTGLTADTAHVAVTVQAAQTGTYTPILRWRGAGGTVGQYILGWDGTAANDGLNEIKYSTDVAGPFGGAVVGKSELNLTGPNALLQFGGYLLTNRAFVAGTDLWLRMYTYFPLDFCFSYGSYGDGWGPIKWFRISANNANGPRSTIEMGTPTAMGDGYNFRPWPTCGTTVALWADVNEMGAGTSPFPYYKPELGGKAITRGVWLALQVQWHFGDGAAGYTRGWVDDVYLGQNNHTTCPAGSVIERLVLGDYWNGGFPKQQAFYIDDIIITTQTPNTLDSGGRPYISPATSAASWG
jgi:hypothetical protein